MQCAARLGDAVFWGGGRFVRVRVPLVGWFRERLKGQSRLFGWVGQIRSARSLCWLDGSSFHCCSATFLTCTHLGGSLSSGFLGRVPEDVHFSTRQ